MCSPMKNSKIRKPQFRTSSLFTVGSGKSILFLLPECLKRFVISLTRSLLFSSIHMLPLPSAGFVIDVNDIIYDNALATFFWKYMTLVERIFIFSGNIGIAEKYLKNRTLLDRLKKYRKSRKYGTHMNLDWIPLLEII